MDSRLYWLLVANPLLGGLLLAGCAQCDPADYPICEGDVLVQCTEAGEPEPSVLVRNDCTQSEVDCMGPGCSIVVQVCVVTEQGAGCVDPSLTICGAGDPARCNEAHDTLLTCDVALGYYVAASLCQQPGTDGVCVDGPPAACQ